LKAFNNNFPNIETKSTTTQELENIIKSLKPKHTCGYDEIPTNLIKISLVNISSALNHVCNTALFYGIFPQCLKYCVVKSLYQKDERYCISNYRPVSIMSSFEKVMYSRLIGHLNDNNKLVEEKFGFRKNLTT
jgi:hypothetical protein